MKLKMAADQVLKRFSGKIVKEDASNNRPFLLSLEDRSASKVTKKRISAVLTLW